MQQFFREVRWTDLDYLVVDMPPGTGDVALSLSQTVPVAGSIVVTTPQKVSLADSRRAVAMYKKLNIPPIGIIENMAYFACPNCAHEADIFGHGGGEQLAAELGMPFIGRVPIYQPIREGSDSGVPLMICRARLTGCTRVHVCGRADGRSGFAGELQSNDDDSAHRREVEHAARKLELTSRVCSRLVWLASVRWLLRPPATGRRRRPRRPARR